MQALIYVFHKESFKPPKIHCFTSLYKLSNKNYRLIILTILVTPVLRIIFSIDSQIKKRIASNRHSKKQASYCF